MVTAANISYDSLQDKARTQKLDKWFRKNEDHQRRHKISSLQGQLVKKGIPLSGRLYPVPIEQSQLVHKFSHGFKKKNSLTEKLAGFYQPSQSPTSPRRPKGSADEGASDSRAPPAHRSAYKSRPSPGRESHGTVSARLNDSSRHHSQHKDSGGSRKRSDTGEPDCSWRSIKLYAPPSRIHSEPAVRYCDREGNNYRRLSHI